MKLTQTQLTIALGLAALGAAYFVARKAAQAGVSAVEYGVQALNPAGDQNIFYRAANAVGGVLATEPDSAGKNADGSWSLGNWLYDVSHPDTAAQVRQVTQPVSVAAPQISREDELNKLMLGTRFF